MYCVLSTSTFLHLTSLLPSGVSIYVDSGSPTSSLNFCCAPFSVIVLFLFLLIPSPIRHHTRQYFLCLKNQKMRKGKARARAASHGQDGLSSSTMTATSSVTASFRGEGSYTSSRIEEGYASSQTLSLEVEEQDHSATERGSSPTAANEEDVQGNTHRKALWLGRWADPQSLASVRSLRPLYPRFPIKSVGERVGPVNREDGNAQLRNLASAGYVGIEASTKGSSQRGGNTTRQRKRAKQGEQNPRTSTPVDIMKQIIPKVSTFLSLLSHFLFAAYTLSRLVLSEIL